MAKTNLRNGKAGSGRKFVLDGQLYWGVPEAQIDDWQGPGVAVPRDLMYAAAQRLYAALLLGTPRAEAEQEVREWLESGLQARRYLSGS